MNRAEKGGTKTEIAWACAAAVLLTGWFAATSGEVAAPQPSAQKEVVTTRPSVAGEDAWKEIQKLVDEQKLQGALDRVVVLREEAAKRADEAAWTRGLVQETQLRTALHGYETAVRALKGQPWPSGLTARGTLDLYYAHTLVNYLRMYSWEIQQRERVASRQEVDLRQWTADEIAAAAKGAYVAVWQVREQLGKEGVAALAEYLEPGNYPTEVRPTLRDAVTYLFAGMLANSSLWRPEQGTDVAQLDLDALLSPPHHAPPAEELSDPKLHPLATMAMVLGDLEAWHGSEGRREAQLEARLERLRTLHASFTAPEDREKIRTALEDFLSGFTDVPWWAVGQATLAEFIESEDTPDALARARAVALEGARAFPTSIGGQRCRHIVARIEAPSFDVVAMSSDGPAERSLQVTHRNLGGLYFRAFRYDLAARVESAETSGLLPSGREAEELARSRRPDTSWRVVLPPTPDFREHRTFVTPPLGGFGTYLIVASAKEDFGERDNQIVAVNLTITDLVIVTREGDAGGVDVTVVSGETGKPQSGVEVSLYRFDWRNRHRRMSSLLTGSEGRAVFGARSTSDDAGHFLLARRGDQATLAGEALWLGRQQRAGEETRSLLFTDRSVYRPLQTIHWKVLVFRGIGAEGRFRTVSGSPVTVSLTDANGDEVATLLTRTNEFGSASGEFTIPGGRLLGSWGLESSLDGETEVRVEEYKRPTFEVAVKEPPQQLRLNRPAELVGEARYYFGLPVGSGTVRWAVTREPVYRFLWWGWRPPGVRARAVAGGTSTLEQDGSFHVSFTPVADERDAKRKEGVSYRFRLSVDVTDEGGETRSASEVFRLGFVAVEAELTVDTGFVEAGSSVDVKVARADLDGKPRGGTGRWRLVSLRQPGRALLPADQPLPGGPAGERGYETAGDRQRPRWDTSLSPEAIMSLWEDGEEIAGGEIVHPASGTATITLPPLGVGPYRLHYETRDDFGGTFAVSREIVVAGAKGSIKVPVLLRAERETVHVGESARLLVASGLPEQALVLELYRDGKVAERRQLVGGKAPTVVQFPVSTAERGGFTVRVWGVRDHQLLSFEERIHVPWDDRELKLTFSTFRDVLRPGSRESFRVVVSDPSGRPVGPRVAELLAYMYDRSLDIFAPHLPPNPLAFYPWRGEPGWQRVSLGQSWPVWREQAFAPPSADVELVGSRLRFYDSYGIGGPGRRRFSLAMEGREAEGVLAEQVAVSAPAAPAAKVADRAAAFEEELRSAEAGEQPTEEVALRADFAETAFFQPHLLTGEDGSATVEFQVPDSVTSWNVWVHAVTRDLRAGSLHREARSVKELMVRAYLPRFLREGDEAQIVVMVNNASERTQSGTLAFDILDPANNESVRDAFGLAAEQAQSRPFSVSPGGGTTLSFPVKVPVRLGLVAVQAVATAGDLSDGELRPLPLLPGRMHLVQSRFVALREGERRTVSFEDLIAGGDPSLVNESLTVNVDAQLFYSALAALPYLVNYPYECTEQILNRFVSTGILTGLYSSYPEVGRMAEQLAKRTTPLETWDATDPNRKMELEETPWLVESRGGVEDLPLANVLDPRVALAEREAALAKLAKAQTSSGGFPWWPGGPPSAYMTLYLMYGFAKAAEFGVTVPRDMVEAGWRYLAREFRDDYALRMMRDDCCWEFLTFLNYVASCYPDPSWLGNALTDQERRQILEFSFKHWKQHSPYLKAYLALTLKRSGRPEDARLVFASILDSAKTTRDEGTSWAPEDRSWLWYNDTIESHAMVLRALVELAPDDSRREGLVQWLMLNKKLNHWKSTRATAEVLYALAHVLKAEGAIETREAVTVEVGGRETTFNFEPDRFTGKGNRVIVPGEKVDAHSGSVSIEKQGKGLAFASAVWHFSTERLPEREGGDLLSVSRTYFLREVRGEEVVLVPLAESAGLAPGDEIEVHLSLRSRHPAEYVHLRDPRAAGLEPVSLTSSFKWDLGVSWYEEVRDSGTNFFFEQLPQGEYTFKVRLRAATAGRFRVAPATVQSMYAPEFTAHSSGAMITVRPQG